MGQDKNLMVVRDPVRCFFVFFLVTIFSVFLRTAEAYEGSQQAGQLHNSENRSASLVVHVGDRLNIQVYRDKDLSGIFPVGAEGNIHYPLLGDVFVRDKTLEEVKVLLTEKLGQDYLVDPQVQVEYEKSLSKTLVIFGQITKPGSYEYTPDMTILKLISEAGGLTQVADLGRVSLVRSDGEGKKTKMRVNVKRILDGKDDDLPLQVGDIIVIPETFF